MCQRFIIYFTDKVIEKIDYEYCKYGDYKLFDENLLKFVGRINYRSEVEDKFYFDLAIYYFHKDVKSFVDILRILHIHSKENIIKTIAHEIQNNHLNCSLDDNKIVFSTYDNISWNELSYINAEDKDKYFGEKEKMNFEYWLKIFLKNFT